MAETLPDEVARALAAAADRLGPFARIQYHADVISTNDIALALAERGTAEGTAVLADRQRGGRGRRGRSWFSPPGAGVYLSVIVRPRGAATSLSLVTLAAGVAAATAIRAATGLHAELKWPNDLVVGRPWRKLGGILCEGVASSGGISAVVIGIGINLQPTAYPEALAGLATSIEGELGRSADRAMLVVELLASLKTIIMDALWRGRSGEIRDAWRALAASGFDAAPVRWEDQHGVHRGFARDIDDEGALIVETAGRLERIVAGEVIWERLSRD